MNVTLARTFLAVVDTGSFVAAAARLHVTQSTVSARIQMLEDQLGKSLFDRSKAGASPTHAGTQFQRHALAMVRVWDHARLEVGLADHHSDHLGVGAQHSLWDGFLLHWAAWMRAEAPDIAISATLGFSTVLMDRLAEGTLDLAIMYRPVQQPGLIIEKLYEEELTLVTSLEDTSGLPGKEYVYVNWGPEFQVDHALNFPDLTQPGLNLDLGTLGVHYLLENRASGYFPLRVALPHLESGQLKMVPDAPRFIYPAYAVYPENREEATFETALKGLRDIARDIDRI